MRNSMPFRPRDEAQEKAIKQYMKEKGLNQSEAMRTLIDKALDRENRFSFLDDNPCLLRDYLGEDEAPPKIGKGWFCMKKAPALKILGSGIESAAGKICGKCKIRDGALADSKLLKEQRTKGITQKIPQCAKGAKLSEDMTEFRCPQVGRWRPIIDRKKKTDYKPCRLAGKQNSNCPDLSWSTVVIKGKLPEGQNL